MDLFIKTSLNHMFIRPHLASKPNSKIISNSKKLFNAMDLLPIPFGGVISTKSHFNPETTDDNKNSKPCIIEI